MSATTSPPPETLEDRLARLAGAGPEAITARLAELDREWSAGRGTKAVVGVAMTAGLVLTAVFGPAWLVLPAFGGLFLLQYLFGRTSWLGRTLREMGLRSGAEIERERLALRALRGDFRHLPTVHDLNRGAEGGLVVGTGAHSIDLKEAAHELVEATRP